jgi:cytochrome c biogenesis protein CcdA
MIELLPKLIPLLIVDVLNPVLFALMIVAIGTNKPLANSTSILAGHTAAYFFSGIVIALGLDQIIDRLENPHPIDFVIELSIGLLCLWVALASRNGKASKKRNPEGELSPAYCFGYGAVVNLIGIPFALPYFAVVNQLNKANLSTETSLLVLTFYNVAYAIPFMLVPVMVAIWGNDSKPILEKINNVLTNLADRCMPILFLILGAALSADALTFLVSGKTLW